MNITPEVNRVLETLSIDSETRKVQIAGALARPLYVAVDSVLQACGGKWDRRAKAHVFEDDPTDLIADVIETGKVETLRERQQRLGAFWTPAPLAAELVQRAGIRPGQRVLEPSAGSGRLAWAALEAGAFVTAVEIDRAHYSALLIGGWREAKEQGRFRVERLDFMDLAGFDFDHVLANPPFCKSGRGDHLDHVRHAFGMLRIGGRLTCILPSSVTFRADKRHKAFRQWVAANGGQISPLPADSFLESGTRVLTVLLEMIR